MQANNAVGVLLWCILLSIPMIRGDPCTLAKGQAMTLSAAKACVNMVPFIENVRKSTLDTVRKIHQMYVYRDIAMNSTLSGSLFSVSTDIEAGLNQIATATFTSDWQFQIAVARLFASLNDAHTAYFTPTCYSNFLIMLPFAIQSSLVQNTSSGSYYQSLYISPISDSGLNNLFKSAYSSLFKNDSTIMGRIWDYYGWSIVSINGENPMKYFLNFVDTSVSFSRDRAARFNYALSDGWYLQYLRQNDFPQNEYITLVLQQPANNSTTTVIVRYFAMNYFFKVNGLADMLSLCGYVAGARRDVEHATTRSKLVEDPSLTSGEKELVDAMLPLSQPSVSQNRRTDTTAENAIQSASTMERRTLLQTFPIFTQKLRHEMQQRNKVQSTVRKLGDMITGISPDGFLVFTFEGVPYISFIDLNNGTGVLVLETFLPSDVPSYIQAVKSSINIAYSRNIKNLIVDLFNNGGGYNCLAFSIAQYLVPWLPSYTIMEPAQDTILTLTSYSYYRCPSVWLYYGYYWYDAATQALLSGYDNGFVANTRTATRGGRTSTYTRLYSGQCPTDFGFGQASPLIFTSQNLTLLTKGTCGSACGFFLKVLRMTNNAKVVSYGGLYEGSSMPASQYVTVSSFDGASVMSYDFIAQVMRGVISLGVCAFDQVVNLFPSYAAMTFAFTEQYPYNANSLFNKTGVNTTLPLEWTKVTADYHMWLWNDANPYPVYAAATQKSSSGTCLPWEYQWSNCAGSQPQIEHGVYGYPCNAGVYDTTKCFVFRCEPGWYLSADGTRCVQQISANPATGQSMTDYFLSVAFTLFGILMFVALGIILLVGVIVLSILVYHNKKRVAASLYVEHRQLNV